MNLKVVAAAMAVGLGVGTVRAEMENATPESQGVSSRAILNWIDACEKRFDGEKEGRIHGFTIVRHGKVIAAGSWQPFDTLKTPHQLWSHSKAFTSTAVGFLVDEGKLKLDERLVDIFPEDLPAKVSDNLAKLRIRDCLTMNAGKAPHVLGNSEGSWKKIFFRQPFSHEPGTHFWYDSDATFMLAAVVEKRSGTGLMDYLRERLFSKIGITTATSGVSPEGIACGGWGMMMTTPELARFGQFYLQKGVWNGQRLLSTNWIAQATSRQTWSGNIVLDDKNLASGNDWQQGYGFQFWRCRHNCYRADGAAGQFTIVMPDQDAVVSIHAGVNDTQAELNLVWEHLLPAMKAAPLPEDPASVTALAKRCAELEVPAVSGDLKDVRSFYGAYGFKDNARGFRSIYLFGDSKTTFMKIYARCWPYDTLFGCGKWIKGRCRIDPEGYEGLGMLPGVPMTAASAAMQTNGTLVARLYFPQTIHCLDLVFSDSNGVKIVRGKLSYARGANALEGVRNDAPPKVWDDLPAINPDNQPWEERRKFLSYKITSGEFGFRPVERPKDLAFETVKENPILGGKGMHRKVKISCTGPYAPFAFTADAYFPKDAKAVPTFVSVSLKGRLDSQKFNPDAEDPTVHSLPVSNVLARGMAVITFTNTDVATDDEQSHRSGVFKAFGPLPENRKQRDWGTLSAWAWGASRVADWAVTQPEFDAKRLAVIGHSRGGKTSLWAGATDDRFYLTCVNCSGTGGAKLNHMDLPLSESLESMQKGMPWWFSGYYPIVAQESARHKMEFDQHMLLALVAPRKLAVGSGSGDSWAGPPGERAAVELAAPIWEKLGVGGLHENVFYHVRPGPHDLAPSDWESYMNAMEKSSRKVQMKGSWCSLGTSITWYNDNVKTGCGLFTRGYQDRVRDVLKFAAFSNRGVNGGTVASQLKAVDVADWYTIEHGINDWGHSVKPGTIEDYVSNASNGTFAATYRQLTDKIRYLNPKAKVILCTPRKGYGFGSYLPKSSDEPKNGIYLSEYAKVVREIAAREGFELADFYATCGEDAELKGLSIDVALHPNDIGFQRMANELEKAFCRRARRQ